VVGLNAEDTLLRATQWNVIHCIFEESNSALKVDTLVNKLLRKRPLNVLVPTGELSFVYTHSALFTPISLRIHVRSCAKQ
jgi:hypothetical protein